MKHLKLGKSDIKISRMGLGCMGLSEYYFDTNEKSTESKLPIEESKAIETLHKAVELGINFFDTSDIYGCGHNEILLGKAFKDFRDKIVIASKFGIMRDPKQPISRKINGQPAYAKSACEASLKRLGIDCIDLYYLHRIDPTVPIEDTIGAMADLVKEGKVRFIGISEGNVDTIKRAYKVHPLTAIQSEYSLWTRDREKDVLPLCQELEITFVAYSPMGRGFLSGKITPKTHLAENDLRKHLPRFQEENLEKNMQLVADLQKIAKEMNCSTAQLALAWIMSKYPHTVPIPGAGKIQHLIENVQAIDLALSPTDIAKLDNIFKPEAISGARYTETGLSMVNL